MIDAESTDNVWGCLRAVDWEEQLRGRRRRLVQASMPVQPAPNPAARPGSWWTQDRCCSLMNTDGSGIRFSVQKCAEEHDTERGRSQVARLAAIHAASIPPKKKPLAPPPEPSAHRRPQQLQTHYKKAHGNVSVEEESPLLACIKDTGSVVNGGRKLVTTSGQKIVIKFSAKVGPSTPGKSSVPGTPRDAPSTPVLSHKKHKALAALAQHRVGNSPRMAPSSTPTTPRGADWGLDDYVYGGPRTHTKIVDVKVKEIETPRWIRKTDTVAQGSKGDTGKKLSRSMTVGSKYAKPRANGVHNGGGDVSSDENTDDETYLARHRPLEEQEIRFRFPKQLEREEKHKAALLKEGVIPGASETELAYKSLWYRSDSFNNSIHQASTATGGSLGSPTGRPHNGLSCGKMEAPRRKSDEGLENGSIAETAGDADTYALAPAPVSSGQTARTAPVEEVPANVEHERLARSKSGDTAASAERVGESVGERVDERRGGEVDMGEAPTVLAAASPS